MVLISNSTFSQQYSSYQAENGEIVGNANGSVTLTEFASVEENVEGHFVLEDAYSVTVEGSNVLRSRVKIEGEFRVRREL